MKESGTGIPFTFTRRTFLVATGATAAALAAACSQSFSRTTTLASLEPAKPSPLSGPWQMQSSEITTDPGEKHVTPNAAAGKWYNVTLPCTVLAGLVQN